MSLVGFATVAGDNAGFVVGDVVVFAVVVGDGIGSVVEDRGCVCHRRFYWICRCGWTVLNFCWRWF